MQIGAFPAFESDIEFARELLQEEAVVLLPGTSFLSITRTGVRVYRPAGFGMKRAGLHSRPSSFFCLHKLPLISNPAEASLGDSQSFEEYGSPNPKLIGIW
jgi:hypothetical protein